jgi:hypothetical protein
MLADALPEKAEERVWIAAIIAELRAAADQKTV